MSQILGSMTALMPVPLARTIDSTSSPRIATIPPHEFTRGQSQKRPLLKNEWVRLPGQGRA